MADNRKAKLNRRRVARWRRFQAILAAVCASEVHKQEAASHG